MTADPHSDETWYSTDEVPSSRTWPWIWFLLLAVGLVVLEVFADPAVVICVACGKLGWSDLVTALWLRRRDPNSRRGATWCWFYLAHGLWKITIGALGMTIVLLLTAAWVPKHLHISVATVWLCIAAFSLSSFVTWMAVFLARQRRVRVWVNSSIHRSRARDQFPPALTGVNRADRLVMTAALMIFIAGFAGSLAAMFLLAACVEAFFPQHAANNGLAAIMGGALGVGLPVGLGCLILIFRDVANVVLSATTPDMCWQAQDPIVYREIL